MGTKCLIIIPIKGAGISTFVFCDRLPGDHGAWSLHPS